MSPGLISTDRNTVPLPVSVARERHHWAILLAGGDGTRLQSLTRTIAGDSRPKQFCKLLGNRTLLEQTRARVEPLFYTDRQVFVVARAHEPYYRPELEDTDHSQILVQPSNRGTGVAIALAAARIAESNPEALVAFFPCDHSYSDDDAFAERVRAGMNLAEMYPASIVLLGAEATHPEVEYGWIEPGSPILNPVATHPWAGDAFRVKGFWEKPNVAQAQELLRRGLLWNTFVCMGRASAFLDLLASHAASTLSCLVKTQADEDLENVYQRVHVMDFSREVLMRSADRLLVLRDRDSGWMDLGSPSRLLSAMLRNGFDRPWLSEVR